MRFKVSDIYDYARATVLGRGRLPWIEFTPAQRRVLGSLIFSRSDDLVGRVGRVMQEQQPLFARYPVRGDALLERQQRARGWRLLADAFLLLHGWANDFYLLEQATAVSDAQTVLHQVEAEEQIPFGADDQTRWRRIVLDSAFQILDRRVAAARQAGRRRRGITSPPRRGRAAGPRTLAPGGSAAIQRILREAWEQVRDATYRTAAAEDEPG